MIGRLGRSVRLVAAAVAIAAVAAAMAAVALAGPPRNARYTGTTAHGKRPLTVRVSSDGRSAKMDLPFPPLFCQGGGGLERQIESPAPIGSDGSFHGLITYEYRPNHRRNIKVHFSGRFSGRSVSGAVHAEYLRAPQCNGRTGYSARR